QPNPCACGPEQAGESYWWPCATNYGCLASEGAAVEDTIYASQRSRLRGRRARRERGAAVLALAGDVPLSSLPARIASRGIASISIEDNHGRPSPSRCAARDMLAALSGALRVPVHHVQQHEALVFDVFPGDAALRRDDMVVFFDHSIDRIDVGVLQRSQGLDRA